MDKLRGAPIVTPLYFASYFNVSCMKFQIMTEEELREIEERVKRATPGPWYAHNTDDCLFSSAQYISTSPSKNLTHDNIRSLCENSPDQVAPTEVIAITVLQNPYLALNDLSDENALFIAHARTDIEKLIAELRKIKGENK